MSGDILAANSVLCYAVLVAAHLDTRKLRHYSLWSYYTHEREDLKSPLVDLATTIRDNTDNNFLPTLLTPSFTPVTFTQVRNVLHYTMHCPTEQFLIFVVHRHDNKKFRPSRWVVMHLTQSETGVFEIIRITGRSRVTHVGELSLVALRTHSEKFGRYGRIKNKVSVEQPEL